MPRIDYVIWYVESLARSVEFYRDVLGFEVRIEGDGYVEFTMDNTKMSRVDHAKTVFDLLWSLAVEPIAKPQFRPCSV